jgi:hypothetical protein
MKLRALVMALGLLSPAAYAADLPTKAPNIFTSGYPTKCGGYYGIGTGGNAGAVNGAAVGTQIVQGDLDALIGYTCPFAGNAFWFVEAQGGFSNLNGGSNGLALTGPAMFIERAGVGSPIQQYLSGILPNLNLPALPSIPALSGVTANAGPQSYLFAGLVEQDISAQILGAPSGHDWIIAPMIGAGLLTRYSNNMVVDTWAGWQMNATQSVCTGMGCVKPGNMARVGISLKY